MTERGLGGGWSKDGMILERGSGSGQYIETEAKRTKAGTFIRLIRVIADPLVYM